MHNLRMFPIAAAFLATLLLHADLPPGAVDPTFDFGVGAFTAAFNPYKAAAVLPDGSAVLAGPAIIPIEGPKLTHVLANGRYDYRYTTNLSISGVLNTLAFQPGGGLLVGGQLFINKKPGPTGLFGVIRLDATGSFDPSFVADAAANQFVVTKLTVLPDQSILVVRNAPVTSAPVTNRPPLIIKLKSNGHIDPTFHCHVVPVTFGAGVEAVQVLDDGRILVGGQFVTEATRASQVQKLVRLMPDGRVDPDYEEPGNVVTAALVDQLAIVEDGLLASVRATNGPDSLIRLHSDGSEDLFLADYRLQPPMRFISGVWEDPDGYVIISGPASQPVTTNLALVRMNPLGIEDSTYPARVQQLKGGAVTGILPFPDGGLLVYGNFGIAGAIARPGFMRVFPDGNPDPNFGRMGATFNSGTRENYPVTTLVPLHDGLLVGGKFQTVNGVLVNQLAKLRLDGSIDTRFSTNGAASQTQVGAKTLGFELPDGRIVLAAGQPFLIGRTNLGSVFRLLPDGRWDSTFKPRFSSQSIIFAAALQPDGGLLISGHPLTNMPGHNLNVVRILPDGSLDPAFALPAPATVPANTPISALAVQKDGRIVVATSGGFIGRYDAAGQRDMDFQTLPNPISSQSASIATLPDGDVYLSGYTITNTPVGQVQLAHWNPDGSFDRGFKFPLRGLVDEVQASGEDRIMVRGSFNPLPSTPRVFRCFSNGSIDYSFVVPDHAEVVHAMAVAADYVYISAISRNGLLSNNYTYDHVVRYGNRIAPFSLPVLNNGAGHFITLNFFGPVGRHYLFDASPDLLNWFQIADLAIPTNGIVPLLDDLPKDARTRFYRARPVE